MVVFAVDRTSSAVLTFAVRFGWPEVPGPYTSGSEPRKHFERSEEPASKRVRGGVLV